jgi:rhodanese-related sulfurtransferase
MAVMGPLAKTGEISQSLNLWLAAFPIGFLFGYALQRAGLTDSRKIAAAFYLKDVDVPVVMFTAIVVAALGLWGLSLLEVLDIGNVYLVPTYLAPMAVGGLIFGVGMVMGGYCPGTSFAALVTGKLDALVFALGFLAGTLLFGDLFPIWKGFYGSESFGVLRLDHVLGIGLGPTLLLVVLVAVGGSIGLRRLQRYFWHNVDGTVPRGIRVLVGLAILIAAVLAFFPNRSFFAITETAGSMGGWDCRWEDPCESVMVDPLKAGRLAYDYQDRLRCFDVRDPFEHQRSHLQGAVSVKPAELEAMDLDPATLVILYGRQGDPQVREAVGTLRRRGLRAFAVEGGFEALESYYVDPLSPRLKASLSADQLSELETYRALCAPRPEPQEGAASR